MATRVDLEQGRLGDLSVGSIDVLDGNRQARRCFVDDSGRLHQFCDDAVPALRGPGKRTAQESLRSLPQWSVPHWLFS